MTDRLAASPGYQSTMAALERVKRTSSVGNEFWLAREINELLGYPQWREFESVMGRARDSLSENGIEPSHHFGNTHKMVALGSGSKRSVEDFFLSRAACYLIAMNGDPSKPEIAAAQAYFVVQTRKHELDIDLSESQKRLQLRDKVTQSFKRVSGVAQEAGVRSNKQAIFHDARYQGLYGMSLKDLKSLKGMTAKDQIFDRAGPLELSANDFQMNLAADVIAKENIKGETRCIATNKALARKVRQTMADSGATMPEKLPLEPPIKEIARRLKALKKPE